ncbi:MAG TPA: hypothetical protein VGE67_01065, partial [Haloferula sp.]
FGAAVLLVMLLITGLAITAAMYESERKTAIEQLRLKNEAQAARNQESRLRKQADARSNVARAAFLLDQGRIDEADALRRDYPLESIEPSLEAAAVFRSLGDWNSEHGRWDQAHQCFQLLRQANRQDNAQKILQGDDLMAISAALLREDATQYLEFRDEMMDRYTPAEGQQKAEHLLKVCLLQPADSRILETLRKDVDTMGDPRKTPCPAWSSLSLSLYHLRNGDYREALDACEMGITSPECKSSCQASLEAVAAMAHAHRGNTDSGGASLRKARDIVRNCDGKDFAYGKPIRPYWFDWAIAELLIKEAGERVETASR